MNPLNDKIYLRNSSNNRKFLSNWTVDHKANSYTINFPEYKCIAISYIIINRMVYGSLDAIDYLLRHNKNKNFNHSLLVKPIIDSNAMDVYGYFINFVSNTENLNVDSMITSLLYNISAMPGDRLELLTTMLDSHFLASKLTSSHYFIYLTTSMSHGNINISDFMRQKLNDNLNAKIFADCLKNKDTDHVIENLLYYKNYKPTLSDCELLLQYNDKEKARILLEFLDSDNCIMTSREKNQMKNLLGTLINV
jgi:hypothetical protein